MNMIERAMRILKGRNDIFGESDELFQRNIIIRKAVYQPKENDMRLPCTNITMLYLIIQIMHCNLCMCIEG